MATLSDEDIETLFSGAPQYFARSEGHFTGAPHPSAAYPWDDSLGIRDLTDHIRIEDEAWSSVTAWPHVTLRSADNSLDSVVPELPADEPPPIKKRGHYYPRCRERPSMLSLQGLEKGTIGYEAALELGVSDSLQEEQFGFDSVASRPAAIREARRRLIDPVAATTAATAAATPSTTAAATERPSTSTSTASAEETLGRVQFVGETQILEELIKNGRRYATGSFRGVRQGQDFYDNLFGHILRAPKKVRQHGRSSSAGTWGSPIASRLATQIEALLDVLATPNVWIDFSHVEWRLRLGQILWTSSAPDDFDDGLMQPQDDSSTDERYTERYWLLLQILLSTELLLRLDAITEGDEVGLEFVKPAEVQRFEKEANQAVRWSLILARAWLENIEVIRVDESEEGKDDKKAPESPAKEKLVENVHPAQRPGSLSSVLSRSKTKEKRENPRHTLGWITTLTRKLSLAENRAHAPAAPPKKITYAMRGKYVRRQQRGIAHFARELRWPYELVGPIFQNHMVTRESLNAKVLNPTPTNSKPSTPTTPRSPDTSLSKSKLDFSRHVLRRRKIVAGLHPGGWLSKSYLSGLMLPGDGLCNLLMASLLEGDETALKELGPIAHLGAGFVYRGKSFWSTVSVVGRVLAAGAGAAECMGWVSSDVLPQGLGNGWYNVDVDEVLADARQVNKRARLWGKVAIERESSVLGDGDPASVLPADFVIPFEMVYKERPPMETRVQMQRFELYTPFDPARSTRKRLNGNKAEETAADPTKPTPPFKTYYAEAAFVVSSDGEPEQVFTCELAYDIYFVTAHPCVPAHHVKVLKSPTSPTIQQVDITGTGGLPGLPSSIGVTGHPLHKYYTYASIHLTTLLKNKNKTLEELLVEYVTSTNKSAQTQAAKVLVIDCITGFRPQPAAHEMPLSPVVRERASIDSVFPPLTKEISPMVALSPPLSAVETAPMTPLTPLMPMAELSDLAKARTDVPRAGSMTASSKPSSATSKMHHETRRRRFGSDMEIMVRALCAEKGWNAIVSRRRRGCLACAIRESGALGWKVVIRVD